MDLDSPFVREEAKWSSTPSCRQIAHACRVKMRLPFERSSEASYFFQATFIADSLLSALVQLY